MSRLMAPLARRALTGGEVAAGQVVFAEQIAWARVQVWNLPGAPFGAMAPMRRTIIYGGPGAAADFAAGPIGELGWLVHELAHVWQAARGVILPAAKLGAIGRGAYRLRLLPGKPFSAYNIEQQAEIARFLFLHRIGAASHAEGQPRAALEAIWPVSPGAGDLRQG